MQNENSRTYVEHQQHCPAMSEFKRLQNPLNSIGGTAVHADRTKCHKQKQLRRVTVQRALQWLASLFSRRAIPWPATKLLHLTTAYENVNLTTHATAFKLITTVRTSRGGVTVNQIRTP